VSLDVEDVAGEQQVYFVVGRCGDGPRAVDGLRVVAGVVGRRYKRSRTVLRQLDRAATTHQHPGVVETEPGRRLPVRVGHEPNSEIVARRRPHVSRQLSAAVATEARRTRVPTVEYLPRNRHITIITSNG